MLKYIIVAAGLLGLLGSALAFWPRPTPCQRLIERCTGRQPTYAHELACTIPFAKTLNAEEMPTEMCIEINHIINELDTEIALDRVVWGG